MSCMYLQHDFVHVVNVTEILDNIGVFSVGVDDSRAGMATLGHQSSYWPLLDSQEVSSKSNVLDQSRCSLLPSHTVLLKKY